MVFKQFNRMFLNNLKNLKSKFQNLNFSLLLQKRDHHQLKLLLEGDKIQDQKDKPGLIAIVKSQNHRLRKNQK